MKTIKDLEFELEKELSYFPLPFPGFTKALKTFLRAAIETAFEETRVESRDEQSGYDEEAIGFNTALTRVAKRQEEYLNN